MSQVISLPRPSFAVGQSFFTLSLLFGSWVSRIPEVQSRLMLTEGQLGLSLLGASAGAFAIMPISNWLMTRMAPGRATLLSSLFLCGTMALPAFAWDRWSLTAALFLVGLNNGWMNVAMNAAASSIEKHFRVSIMSSCHGMFSLGGVVGATTGGLIASMDVPLALHLAVLGLLLAGIHLLTGHLLMQIPGAPRRAGAGFTWPRGGLWWLVGIGFCIMIGEGAIADWSAVYLRNDLHGSALVAGLGYAAFCLSMAAGRFAGDALRRRWGADRLLLAGSLLGAAGLLLAIFIPFPNIAVVGFAITGAGFSIIVPLLYSWAAQQPGLKPEAGIAAIATSGIIGFLVGPPLIGVIAEHLGLSVGLGMVAGLSLMAALLNSIKGGSN